MVGETSRSSMDTLRGLACLLLVAFHVVGGDTTGLRLESSHVAREINEWLALVRMPLFSFLSGIVYARRPLRGEVARFARGKVRRLLVPMLLVGTAFAVLQSVVPGANGGRYDWSLLHIVPVSHYWFLPALFWIFMLVALLDRAGILSSAHGFTAIGLAAAVLFAEGRALPVHFGLRGAAYLLPFFLAGLGAVRFGQILLSRRAQVVLALVALLVLLRWSFTAIPVRSAYEELTVSLCACTLLLQVNLKVHWLMWIGRWSFGIYLFHPVFSAASRIVLSNLGVSSVPLLFSAGLVVGLAGSMALTSALRRVPYAHWSVGERPARAQADDGEDENGRPKPA